MIQMKELLSDVWAQLRNKGGKTPETRNGGR